MIFLKHTTIPFVSFVVLILLGLFVVLPQLQGIERDAATLSSKVEERIVLEQEQRALGDFQEFVELHRAEFAIFDNLFIDPVTPVSFLAYLEGAAGKRGIDLKISPGNLQRNERDPWPFIEFQLSFTGGFPQFFSFLKDLENAPYAIEIQNFTLAGSEEGKISASLSIKTYTK